MARSTNTCVSPRVRDVIHVVMVLPFVLASGAGLLSLIIGQELAGWFPWMLTSTGLIAWSSLTRSGCYLSRRASTRATAATPLTSLTVEHHDGDQNG